MAQLKIKQISDFVTGVEAKINALVGTSTGTAISTAKSEAISTAVSADAVLSTAVVGQISTAKSEAISTAVSADVVVLSSAKSYADSKDVLILSQAKAHSDIQKGRIDTLLAGKDATLDTFKEISDFITSLETSDVAGLSAALSTAVSNDAVHATGIAANSTAIAGLDFGMDLSLVTDNLVNTINNTNGTGVTLEGATEEKAGLMTANDFRKLQEVEASADVTDYDNVKAAGALMDDEITNLAQVKAFDKTNFATSAQGDKADSALQSYSDLGLTVTEAELNQLASISVGDIITYNADAFDAAGSAATAEGSAIAAAEDYTDGFINALGTAAYNATEDFDAKGDAAQALVDAKKYTNDEIAALDADLQGQIDGLAGVAFEEVLANFGDVATMISPIPFDVNNVKVFVNGLQIHEAGNGGEGWSSADGATFKFANLGYDLEADDHVIISGKLK